MLENRHPGIGKNADQLLTNEGNQSPEHRQG